MHDLLRSGRGGEVAGEGEGGGRRRASAPGGGRLPDPPHKPCLHVCEHIFPPSNWIGWTTIIIACSSGNVWPSGKLTEATSMSQSVESFCSE